MKKTITTTAGFLCNKAESLSLFAGAHADCTVTLSWDDDKPSVKTVWEWMWQDSDGDWRTVDALMSEGDAAVEFEGVPHKKLREFEVEE
jgi:hypothetical protein